MGGCATKPGVLNVQAAEAPPPLEKPEEVSDAKVQGEGENRREASQNEATNTEQGETKAEEEEQAKAKVNPAQKTEAVETKEVPAPVHEETPVPVSVPDSSKEVKSTKAASENSTTDSSSSMEVKSSTKAASKGSTTENVEQKEAVIEEMKSKLDASSITEKKGDDNAAKTA